MRKLGLVVLTSIAALTVGWLGQTTLAAGASNDGVAAAPKQVAPAPDTFAERVKLADEFARLAKSAREALQSRKPDDALKSLERMRQIQGKPDVYTLLFTASAQAMKGNKDETLRALEQFAGIHGASLLGLPDDDTFDLVKNDPRYAAVAAKLAADEKAFMLELSRMTPKLTSEAGKSHETLDKLMESFAGRARDLGRTMMLNTLEESYAIRAELSDEKIADLRRFAVEHPKSAELETCRYETMKALADFAMSLRGAPNVAALLKTERDALAKDFPTSKHLPEADLLCAKMEARHGLALFYAENAAAMREDAEQVKARPEWRAMQAANLQRFQKLADQYPNDPVGGAALVWVVQSQYESDPDHPEKAKAAYSALRTKWKDDRSVAREVGQALWAILPVFEGTKPFDVKDVEGNRMSLEQYRGKVVLLDFWATSCSPCQPEIPVVRQLHQRFAKDGFVVLGIALEQGDNYSPITFKAWLKERGMSWPQYADGLGFKNKVAELYGVGGIPQTVLIDRKGDVVAAGVRGKSLVKAVERLMAKP